jgi:hypothetical protein
MSDSEEDAVAVDVEVDEEDQSDGNSDDDDDDDEEELVVVAEAVEEESEDEAGAVEVEVEEPEEDDENVALVVEDDDGDGDNDEEDEDEAEEVVEVAADVDDGEENDDVQPQVVVMEDEDEGAGDALVVEAEAVAVAVAVEEDDDEPPAKRSKTNTGKAKTRTPKKKAPAAKTSAKRAPPAKKRRAPVSKKAGAGAKGKPKKGSNKAKSSSSGKNTDMHFARIDSKRMMSANTARELLYETVQKMPFPVNTHQGDTFSVRSFGQLKLGTKTNDKSSNKFSTPTSLYPVGFSCDRIEFSPSHGRFLKLRCAILDGTRVGIDGPLFRVLWGQGIDEDKDKVEYPYDPFSNSAPITGSGADGNENDEEADDVVVAIPTSAGYQPPSSQVAPAVGMRVKTRFDKDKYYYGTISAVTEKEVDAPPTKGKRQTKNNKKKIDLEIAIKYDDGSAEVSVFPDPDISLVMPGAFYFSMLLTKHFRQQDIMACITFPISKFSHTFALFHTQRRQ